MSGHTPGPWTLFPQDRVAAPCHEHPVCEKTIAWIDGDHGPLQCSTGANANANARLIVAALDLLARVKARFAWCDCGSARAGIAVCDDCKADSAAIAKAEGRGAVK